MSSTDDPNITNIAGMIEYSPLYTRISNEAVMIEYAFPGITSAAVMVEYFELTPLPLLAVGQYYGTT